MNFRSTILLFGILLGMLWLFGFVVAYKKTAVDVSFIVPTLQGLKKVEIDSIKIERRSQAKQPEVIQFAKAADEVWSVTVPEVKHSVKVEGFRVQQIINQIKDARRSDEAGVTQNLAQYGLDQPATTVTLRGHALGKKDRPLEWKFYIGRESADKAFLYVNSSDWPNKVYAIAKTNIDSVLFKDPNHLRSRRLFDFSETAVQRIDIKEGAKELELVKAADSIWRFEKPPMGVAEYEGAPPPKDVLHGAKPAEGGVKGLLASIGTIRVDSEEDFEPLSNTSLDAYGLAEGKETMRIEVGSPKEADPKAKEKDAGKETLAKETLAIGKRVDKKGRDQVYARMLGDHGVFKLNASFLEPIRKTLNDPGSLRSMDVANIDAKKVDAIVVSQGKEKITLARAEGKPWEIQVGSAKPQKANEQAVQTLLEAIQGKREIVKYYDVEDAKKLEGELKTPAAEVALFTDASATEKKDAKKDAKDKKDEKKTKEEPGLLRSDAKPALTLRFGASDKDQVNVERVLANGITSRFVVPKALVSKVVPGDITLAFLDPGLPPFADEDVERVAIARGSEKIEIEKGTGDKANRWFFKDDAEPGKSPTDRGKTITLVDILANLDAKRWLARIDPKEDLDKYGLAKPALVVTLTVKKQGPAATAGLAGLLGSPVPMSGLLAAGTVLAQRQADKGEAVVLKIGKEMESEKGAVYAQRSDKDMLFLLPGELVKHLREVDLQDRAGIVQAQALLSAGLIGLKAAPGPAALWAASPLVTNRVHSFDPAKAKEVKVTLRTREELRTLHFIRDAKAKEWQDKSGLQEFNLDSQKVEQLVEQLAKLEASRWVSLAGGPRSEQKLSPKDATLRVEVILEDGSVVLSAGIAFEKLGYFAQTTALPDAVFLIPASQVEPLLRGPGYFAKERLAGLP